MMVPSRRLEIKLNRPNAVFETWLERWLREAEKRNSKSKQKLREALQALRSYPLPLASGRECAILRGFGTTLCNLIDEEIKLQHSKAEEGVVSNSNTYEMDIRQVVEEVKKAARSRRSPSKLPRLTKKEQKVVQEEEERLRQVTMSPGSFAVLLLVDIQETSGKNKRSLDQTRSYLESLGVEYEVRRLTVGDFLWLARDKEGNELVLPYIVERKRMDDLASSIRDGRFHEQKHRLRQCGIQHVIYLIEDYGDNEHLGLPLESLKQALSNTLIQSGFNVVHTDNHWRSMVYLQGMTDVLTGVFSEKVLISTAKEDLRPHNTSDRMVGVLKFRSLYEDSARNAQLSVREIFIQQLLQLHSLSLEKALAITALYPTPRLLLEAFEACEDTQAARLLLAGIRCGQLQRPLGEKLSQIIHDFYTNDF